MTTIYQEPKAGLISGDRFLSQQALDLNSSRAATALHSIGVWKGDSVALLLRNDFAYFEATKGAALLGATTVALNWHMTSEEINYVLNDCDAKVVVGHADLLTESVLAVLEGREVIAVETPLEIAKAYNVPSAACQTPGAIPEWYRWIGSFDSWAEPAQPPSNPMFYTSGTSGLPKGIKRKPVKPEVAQRAASRSITAWGLHDENVVSIMTGPLYHSAPNAYAMNVVRNSGLLVLQPRFNALEMLELIESYRVTHLHMVPTMFVRLLKLPDSARKKADVSSIRYVAHGAAPCPADVKEAMIDWWGPVIHEYYAMTETGIIATCTSEEWLAHPGTVGKAVEGVDISVVNPDRGTCSAGEDGQICVKSETTPFVSYHRDEAQTNALRWGDYIQTGDVGNLDEEGFLYISDRLSDMVISGGVNIYPAEIEKVLITMPGVSDCAVFGVPDEEFGERLVASIEGSEGLNSESVASFLSDRIAGYKVPREYYFDLVLPREDSGKIKKRLLREMLVNTDDLSAHAM